MMSLKTVIKHGLSALTTETLPPRICQTCWVTTKGFSFQKLTYFHFYLLNKTIYLFLAKNWNFMIPIHAGAICFVLDLILDNGCCPTEQDHIPVMRGQWFIDGTWLPLDEDESDLIEREHLNHFRGQHVQDTFEMDLVPRTIDSKDGELWGRARAGQP